MSNFAWGTVTAVDPLRIQLDGDTAPLPFAPDSLVDAGQLTPGDRVRCERSSRRVIVAGRSGGILAGVLATIADLLARITRAPKGAIPASVVVGSGSASVAADGTVTVTGASSVALNGVFDGLGADQYEVIVAMVTSAGATVTTRLRAAGVNVATGYNYTAHYTTPAAGPTRVSAAGAVAFGFFCYTTAGAGSPTEGRMTLYGPKRAATTYMQLSAVIAVAGERHLWAEGGDGAPSACDGIALLASTGTMTGTVKVVKIA